MNSTPLSKVSLVCIHLTVLVGLSVSAAFAQRPTSPASAKEYDQAETLVNEACEVAANETQSAYRNSLSLYFEAFKKLESIGSTAEKVLVLNKIAWTHYKLENKSSAIAAVTEAHSLSKELSDINRRPALLIGMGIVHKRFDEEETAGSRYKEALDIIWQLVETKGESGIVETVDSLYSEIGSKEIALDFFSYALATRREGTLASAEAQVLEGIAAVLFRLGNAKETKGFYEQAVLQYRRIGDASGEIRALGNLGRVLFSRDDLRGALASFEQALALARSATNKQQEAATLINIAAVHEELGEYGKALENLDRALSISKASVAKADEGRILNNMGVVHAWMGEFQKASELLQKAYKMRLESGDGKGQAISLSNLGAVAARLGDKTKSFEITLKALRLSRQHLKNARDESLDLDLKTLTDSLDERTVRVTFFGQTPAMSVRAGLRVIDVPFWLVPGSFAYRQFASSCKTKVPGKPRGREEAVALRNLGTAYADMGDRRRAILSLMLAVEGFRKAESVRDEVEALVAIAELWHELGEKVLASVTLNSAYDRLRQSPNRRLSAVILNVQGRLFSSEGNVRPLAVETFNEAIELFRESRDKKGEAAALNNLGLFHADEEDAAKALEFFNQALSLSRSINDKHGEAFSLNNIGVVKLQTGDLGEAFRLFNAALPVFRGSGDKDEEAAILNNLGRLYDELGQKEKSLQLYEEAFAVYNSPHPKNGESDMFQEILGPDGPALIDSPDTPLSLKAEQTWTQPALRAREWVVLLNNQAMIHADRRDYDKALLSLEKASKIFAEARERRQLSLVSNGEAIVINNVAFVKQQLGRTTEALALYEQISNLWTTEASRATVLNNMASAHRDLGNRAEALKFYGQSLSRFMVRGDRAGEAAVLGNLMGLWDEIGNQDAAVFYGKQAVNLYQGLRGSISSLDEKTKSTYLSSVSDVYRYLAELLIKRGRFAEAHQVLGLLKEDEYYTYTRRDATEISSLSSRADLNPKEKSLLVEYARYVDRLTELEARYTKLVEASRADGEDPEENAEINELKSKLDTANAAFRIFLEKEIAEQFPKNVKREIELDRALQGRLAQWGEGTVALYTILGEDRYRVILTTPKVQVDGKTEIKAADLNKKLFAFREALRDPRIDPKPLGKELYDILIKPIEKQLEGAGAKTLVWSLDGALRYIPIGTLSPDGSSYFAERYRNVVVTSTIRQGLSSPTDGNWRVLGAGVTKQSKVMDPVTGDPVSFSALPGVDLELGRIVLENDEQPAEGILGGTQLLDDTFDARSLGNLLTQRKADAPAHNVVHLATHFRLGTDNARSFLLVGGGKTLTLAEISDDTNLDFSDIELVTLSACDTAFGTAVENRGGNSVGNGAEVDSLATFIELRGAKAVMASLWPVADESTSLLMTEFYRIKAADPKMTKAEALQRAQLAMISGQLKSVGGKGICRSDEIDLTGTGPKRFVCNTDAPYSHPYFWSPFVLIGNWR